MSNLSVFDFDSVTVRTVIDSKQNVWFHATDVCQCLSLSNPSREVSKIKADWKKEYNDSERGGKAAWYIAEPAIYKLAFVSKTLKAEKFQDWVFEDVLPKLRASGYYIAPTATSDQLEQLQREKDQLIFEKEKLQLSNTRLQTKYDQLLSSDAYHKYMLKDLYTEFRGVRVLKYPAYHKSPILSIQYKDSTFFKLIQIFTGNTHLDESLKCLSNYGYRLRGMSEIQLYSYQWVAIIEFLIKDGYIILGDKLRFDQFKSKCFLPVLQ